MRLAAVAILTACGGGDGPVSPPVVPPPVAPPTVTPPSTKSGVLIVTLETPNADDGGVLFDITGPGFVDLVVPGASYELYSMRSAAMASALLAGAIQSGDVLEVHVPDVSKASEYHAVLRQVASAAFELRPSLEGYSVSIHPQAGS
jgi:hypothetical protein